MTKIPKILAILISNALRDECSDRCGNVCWQQPNMFLKLRVLARTETVTAVDIKDDQIFQSPDRWMIYGTGADRMQSSPQMCISISKTVCMYIKISSMWSLEANGFRLSGNHRKLLRWCSPVASAVHLAFIWSSTWTPNIRQTFQTIGFRHLNHILQAIIPNWFTTMDVKFADSHFFNAWLGAEIFLLVWAPIHCQSRLFWECN